MNDNNIISSFGQFLCLKFKNFIFCFSYSTNLGFYYFLGVSTIILKKKCTKYCKTNNCIMNEVILRINAVLAELRQFFNVCTFILAGLVLLHVSTFTHLPSDFTVTLTLWSFSILSLGLQKAVKLTASNTRQLQLTTRRKRCNFFQEKLSVLQ